MIKTIFLCLVMTILTSCKEEEVMKFDDLDPSEQAAIRARGTAQCLEKNTEIYARFKTQSAGVFTSSDYERGDGFEYLLKNGTTTERTVEIKIWKQTPAEIYFYITDDQAGADYFLRVQKIDNDEMIDDLLTAHCARPLPTVPPTTYTASSGSNGPLNITDEYQISRAPNQEFFKDTYSLSFSRLAFFANYVISRTKTVKDVDENQVGNAVNYTSTLTAKAFTFTSTDALDSSLYNQKFCVISHGTAYSFAHERNVEGFKIDLNSADCPTVKPSGWNLAI